MEHVGQGFRVHVPMLEGDIQKRVERMSVGPGHGTLGQRVAQPVVQNCPNFSYIFPRGRNRRPLRRLIVGQSAAHRINTKGKELPDVRCKK